MSEKSEKLYDGITHIREDLLEQRVQKTRKPSWKCWGIRGAAAVLALVFVLGVLLKPEGRGGMVASAHAIAEAKYPKMAQYPGNENYEDYKKWQKSLDSLRQPAGYANGLEDYFTTSMQQFLSGAEGKNAVYSPVNIYMALAMLAEVTDGNSRRQILDALGSGSIEELRQQAASVWQAQYRDDGAVTRTLGSSLWLREDMEYVQATMDTLAENYYASSYRGIMGSAEFNKALQTWLNEQTGGLLEEQAGNIELDAATILAIATTIYYKAAWSNDFNKNATTQEVFHAASGDMTCDFMHQSGTAQYYWGDKFSAIYRNMEAQGGSMWFVLPDEGVTVDELLADEQVMEFLQMEGTKHEWDNQKYLIVNQAIPKFDVVSDFDLTEGLQAMGITDVFDCAVSDFSPMTTAVENIEVSQARHAARVIIDEEGVEAAAYTVLAAPGAGMPPTDEIDFVVDRPFLFVITGADSLPLFVGVVNHP